MDFLQLIIKGELKSQQVYVCLREKSLTIKLLRRILSKAVGDYGEDGFGGGFVGFGALRHACGIK